MPLLLILDLSDEETRKGLEALSDTLLENAAPRQNNAAPT